MNVTPIILNNEINNLFGVKKLKYGNRWMANGRTLWCGVWAFVYCSITGGAGANVGADQAVALCNSLRRLETEEFKCTCLGAGFM